ncbi:hypothetical protein J2D73_07900 [Acetobacter sacchari]|uniref:Transposase n=1 Tax=Acetobacter sacchari TaxID=2661687 RepID=A0ABS3LUX3_9PROT|nr:hypothetical protein [Acetobacter sacchari]MBO1359717.1 hypothetical protein [Acetobacter sacchari]
MTKSSSIAPAGRREMLRSIETSKRRKPHVVVPELATRLDIWLKPRRWIFDALKKFRRQIGYMNIESVD